jgi:hypothetical protein
MKLAREHLGLVCDDASSVVADVENAAAFFDEFARSAALLDAWHAVETLYPRILTEASAGASSNSFSMTATFAVIFVIATRRPRLLA